MCGILGCLIKRGEDPVDLVKPFIGTLRHRGPDDMGLYSGPYIALGHTRLSIIDLSPLGHQPMLSATGRYVISYNGEIYNYLELRRELEDAGYTFISQTDTEVILVAYEKWGSACLGRLRGMFSFALWDREERTLFLARDRMGEKPLIYWQDGEKFFFASELKGLLPMLPGVPPLDPIAVDLYLHYQYVPEPLTPLQGIRKLPAGHYMLVSPDRWQFMPVRYWSLEEISPLDREPVAAIKAELHSVISLTLRSDVPVGVALSGGIDSGGIAALAAPQYQQTMKAFSIGYPGHPPYDERGQAEALAKSLGLEFCDTELDTQSFVSFFPSLVSIMDEPIADIAAYGHYSVAKLAAAQGAKVLLVGLGGDELFWGYPWVPQVLSLYFRKLGPKSRITPSLTWLADRDVGRYLRKLVQIQKLPNRARSFIEYLIKMTDANKALPDGALFMSLVDDFHQAFHFKQETYSSHFLEAIPPHNPYMPLDINLNSKRLLPLQVLRLLFDTWLVSNCLSLGDRVSMASGVETRIPLLDYKLVELVMGLRLTFPDHDLGHKYWLKEALSGTLPDEVLNRPKRGFQPPVLDWLNGVIRSYGALLHEGALMGQGVLSKQFLSGALNPANASVARLFFVFKLVLLEIWYRKVVLREEIYEMKNTDQFFLSQSGAYGQRQ
jgi:asparagine synthase (glutamine-hydrolysing)